MTDPTITSKRDAYPAWVCADCGTRWGRREAGMATWHPDTCGICGQHTMVTEPRDYGHLRDGWQGVGKQRSET